MCFSWCINGQSEKVVTRRINYDIQKGASAIISQVIKKGIPLNICQLNALQLTTSRKYIWSTRHLEHLTFIFDLWRSWESSEPKKLQNFFVFHFESNTPQEKFHAFHITCDCPWLKMKETLTLVGWCVYYLLVECVQFHRVLPIRNQLFFSGPYFYSHVGFWRVATHIITWCPKTNRIKTYIQVKFRCNKSDEWLFENN